MNHRLTAVLFRAVLILTATGWSITASHAQPQPQSPTAPATLQEASKASTEAATAAKTTEKKLSVDLGGGVKMDLVPITSGSFMMGSNDGEADEKPVRMVTLDFFWLGETEVTQAQYEAIMRKNPSGFKGTDKPVEYVSWNDAVEFCKKLSAKTGKTYTLPTEAQWEYACRAGSSGKYCFGDSESQLGDYAWYHGNFNLPTHPVKQKKPNAWGLYDMHGNVDEWCADGYGPYAADKRNNPVGANEGSGCVYRGGWGVSSAYYCRSASRNWRFPDFRDAILGFRVACVPW